MTAFPTLVPVFFFFDLLLSGGSPFAACSCDKERAMMRIVELVQKYLHLLNPKPKKYNLLISAQVQKIGRAHV